MLAAVAAAAAAAVYPPCASVNAVLDTCLWLTPARVVNLGYPPAGQPTQPKSEMCSAKNMGKGVHCRHVNLAIASYVQ
jgi:hypothetical protein